MTQPDEISTLLWVTIVADAETPDEYLPFVGRVIGFPRALVNLISNDPLKPSRLYKAWGYRRLNPSTNEPEFVLRPKLDQATRDMVLAVADPGSETYIRRAAEIMILTYEMPPVLVRELIRDIATYARPLP
jgi:hypothetical protein